MADTHGRIEAMFSVMSLPRLYNEQQLPLQESRETAVRRVGVSCETVASWQGRDHGGSGSYGVGSRYQAITCEDTADWEDLVRAVGNCRVCELAITLQVLVVTFCKVSVNPITNPNPVY
jgi:hypothetical protein